MANVATLVSSGTGQIKKQNQFVAVWNRLKRNPFAMTGMVIFAVLLLMTIFAPVIAPYQYDKIDVLNANLPPSLEHLCGTDHVGRDIFSRLLIGARYSLTLGFASVALGTVAGLVLGCVAGFFGGRVDEVIMRIADVFQSIPSMVLNVAIAVALGAGFWQCIVVLAVGRVTAAARMIRAQILQIRTMEYIEAASVTNCSTFRTIVMHLLPNTFSATLVGVTMGVGGHIIAAAGLAYLGLGVQPPLPEWGTMLAEGRNYLRQFPWMCIFPGILIMLTVLSLNLFGDGLRDALDPKLKK